MSGGGGNGGGATAAPPSSSRGSRLAEFLSRVPLVTLAVLALCIGVYVADNLGDFSANLALFAIQPSAVLRRLELWRLVSAAFVHNGLLHIGMNMMTLYQLGSGLEPLFGSLQYAAILAVFTLAVGVVYVALAAAAAAAVDAAYMHSSAVGFSGVLFAMAVDEASLSAAPTRSVFGLFSVPTRLYPWVLMLLLQLVLPNVSFLGHLAGILVGLVHTLGGFAWAIPSLPTLRRIEQAPACARLVRSGPYCAVPERDVTRSDAPLAEQCRQAAEAARYALAPVTQVLVRCCPRRGAAAAAAAATSSAAAAAAAAATSVLAGRAWGAAPAESEPAADGAGARAAPTARVPAVAIDDDDADADADGTPDVEAAAPAAAASTAAARAAAAAAARVRAARAAALRARSPKEGADAPAAVGGPGAAPVGAATLPLALAPASGAAHAGEPTAPAGEADTVRLISPQP